MKHFEEVFLNDNQNYILDDKSIVETVCDAEHGNWKSNRIPIPEGTQLNVCEVWRNFYGLWVRVSYNEVYYDLYPYDLKYVGRT